MGKYIGEINGIDMYEYECDKFENIAQEISGLEADGVVLRLNQWLSDNDICEESAMETYHNTSGVRRRICIDIHDAYVLDDGMELSFVYVVGGVVWGAIYNSEKDRYIGAIEISI